LFLFAGLLLPRDAFSRVCIYWCIAAGAAAHDDTVVPDYFYHGEKVQSVLGPSFGPAVSPRFPYGKIKPVMA